MSAVRPVPPFSAGEYYVPQLACKSAGWFAVCAGGPVAPSRRAARTAAIASRPSSAPFSAERSEILASLKTPKRRIASTSAGESCAARRDAR